LISAAGGEIASYEQTALMHRMGVAEERRRAREVNGLDPDREFAPVWEPGRRRLGS